MNFTIIGGDNRIINLAGILEKESIDNKIYTYGLDTVDLFKCANLEEAITKSNIIITAIPISKDNIHCNISNENDNEKILIDEIFKLSKNKIIFTGNLSEEIKQKIYSINLKNNNKVIDILKLEEFAILNSIATAEGIIEKIINNTDNTIQNSDILILGYGRIGTVIANKLKLLNSNVSVTYINEEQKAWIKEKRIY